MTKINAEATALLYSTFLGGEGNDRGYAITVDAPGNAYVTGETDSATTFPTWPAGAPLLNYGGGTSDAFVTKISFDGTALVFSTFLGGGNADLGSGIALDGSSNLFITGETASANFPVAPAGNPLRPYGGSIDAFVTKIMENGSAIVFSTFLGGTYIDRGHAVAVDQFGDVYVAGATDSANFPTWPSGRPLFSKSGETDAFVTKIKGNGSALVFSTFLGGTYIDRAYGLAVDRQGSAYITGFTESDGGGTSTPFPQRRALQEYAGGSTDAFVAKIAFAADLPWLMLLLLD